MEESVDQEQKEYISSEIDFFNEDYVPILSELREDEKDADD